MVNIFKTDNFKFGILIGFLGLFVGLVIIYFIKSTGFSFGEFLHFFFTQNQMLTSIGSLMLLANIALFTLYLNTNKDKTAKGIFTITVIYGIAVLLLKVV
ncbi:hypothetical protein ACFS6H_10935 [Terrimonas rubra]|uniref:Uncharacterized protein n=1 Tax=Terrimonas rubra TaxID=1035890 RepID=A0ABW6A4Q4_9BACT